MPDRPVEHALVRAVLRASALAAPPVVAVAGVLRGARGAATVAGGIALVIAVFAATGISLAWAARRGAGALFATAMGGFAARLVFLAALGLALRPVTAIDAPVLAMTVAAGEVGLLAVAVRVALTRRELWWLTLGEEPA